MLIVLPCSRILIPISTSIKKWFAVSAFSSKIGGPIGNRFMIKYLIEKSSNCVYSPGKWLVSLISESSSRAKVIFLSKHLSFRSVVDSVFVSLALLVRRGFPVQGSNEEEPFSDSELKLYMERTNTLIVGYSTRSISTGWFFFSALYNYNIRKKASQYLM